MELQKDQLNFDCEKHKKETELSRPDIQNQRDFNTMIFVQMQAERQASQQDQQKLRLISGLV